MKWPYIEFYVRAIEYTDKQQITNIPQKEFFLLGESKAKNWCFWDRKKKITTQPTTPIAQPNNCLCIVGREYFHIEQQQWLRSNTEIITSLTKQDKPYFIQLKNKEPLLPFGLRIVSIEKDGTAIAHFPRQNMPLKEGKTYAYLCHKEIYEMNGICTFPGVYLVLFIRNNGWQSTIETKDPIRLCSQQIHIRDCRKKSNRFSF